MNNTQATASAVGVFFQDDPCQELTTDLEYGVHSDPDRVQSMAAEPATCERDLQRELDLAMEREAERKTREQKLQVELEHARRREAEHNKRELEVQMELRCAKQSEARRQICEQELRAELEHAKKKELENDALEKELAAARAREHRLQTELEFAKKAVAEQKTLGQRLQRKLEHAEQRAASQKQAGLVWEWQDKGGDWLEFIPTDNKLITEAFLQGKGGCEIIRDGMSYDITLAGREMSQQNRQTRNCRKIRFSLGLPNHWREHENEIIKQVKQNAQAPQSRQIMTFEAVTLPIKEQHLLDVFSQALRMSFSHDLPLPTGMDPCTSLQNARVSEAYQVINYDLLQQYAEFCYRLKGQCSPGERLPNADALHRLGSYLEIPLDVSINEELLLHGTSFENSCTIAIHGWDSRVAKSGMYGRGTYFAMQSCKTHQYSKYTKEKTLHTVLLARVALGKPEFTKTCDKTKTRPAEGHDSVIARAGTMDQHPKGVQTHSEFIIYQHAGIQALPEYILRYTLS